VRPPPQDRRRGTAPHEVWQVDAVEKQRLADGHQASWLTVTDERRFSRTRNLPN
jgi:hypothetical protein